MSGKKVNTDFFKGYIGLIDIKEVSKIQTWKFNGEDITVCDKGLKWLSILPQDDFYCITAMMNERNDILVWYIDMIEEQGIDMDGVPYFNDLYLDLVVYPNGVIMVDDMAELEEALSKKDITQEQFNLAINTRNELKTGLLSDVDTFIEYTQKCYRIIK
jgi:predicted RNA-binding protein associated with RNAse of E/G family